MMNQARHFTSNIHAAEDTWIVDFVDKRVREIVTLPSQATNEDGETLVCEYARYMTDLCDMMSITDSELYYLLKRVERLSNAELVEIVLRRIRSLCLYAAWRVRHLLDSPYYYPGFDDRMDTLQYRNPRLNALFNALLEVHGCRQAQKIHYDDSD